MIQVEGRRNAESYFRLVAFGVTRTPDWWSGEYMEPRMMI